MIKLSAMCKGIRKAAALKGIWSGKCEIFAYTMPEDVGVIVYNRNHPNGVEILNSEIKNAHNYTWREIRNH